MDLENQLWPSFLGQKYRARGNSFKVPISSKNGSFYLFYSRISTITSQILSLQTFLYKHVGNSDDCDCTMVFVESHDIFHARSRYVHSETQIHLVFAYYLSIQLDCNTYDLLSLRPTKRNCNVSQLFPCTQSTKVQICNYGDGTKSRIDRKKYYRIVRVCFVIEA